MMNGLDLFSGIGGLTLALDEWVRPIAYCENDRYASAVLLSRMHEGLLPLGPIWDDVRTLEGEQIIPEIDIITAGFPCQDISCAGLGKGLGGERSGLFFEILRLVEETQPRFVFLENVPAIRTRGLRAIVDAFTGLRYDCRWTVLSAASVGAPHLRKRWFLLAHRNGDGREELSKCHGEEQKSEGQSGHDVDGFHHTISHAGREPIGHEPRRRDGTSRQGETELRYDGGKEYLADTTISGRIKGNSNPGWGSGRDSSEEIKRSGSTDRSGWWAVEPDVGRVAHGVQFRVDRLKCLGNSVVPAQAREAFKILMGLS